MKRKEVLYIIGNGFDLHHGLKSSFNNFREYLEEQDSELLDTLEEYLPVAHRNNSKIEWWDFESVIGHLFVDTVIDKCMNYLESYGSDNWRDSDNHTYQYEVRRIITALTEKLKKRFKEWVLSIKIPTEAYERKVYMKPDSYYLNFNYTNTLEKLYRIPQGKIFFIHNKVRNEKANPILGHSRTLKSVEQVINEYDYESDFRLVEGARIIDGYFKKNFKPTNQILKAHYKYFSSLHHLKEIYVFGHSLSPVDIRYFKKIVRSIRKNKVKWFISAYCNKDLTKFKTVVSDLGINKRLVTFETMQNLNEKQLKLFKRIL